MAKLRLHIDVALLSKFRALGLWHQLDNDTLMGDAFMGYLASTHEEDPVRYKPAVLDIPEPVFLRLKERATLTKEPVDRIAVRAIETYVRNGADFFGNGGKVSATPVECAAGAVRCVHCGNTWVPKGVGRPVVCPSPTCKRTDWDGDPAYAKRQNTCVHCKNIWTPKTPGRSPFCPKCRRTDWDGAPTTEVKQNRCNWCGHRWTPHGPARSPACPNPDCQATKWDEHDDWTCARGGEWVPIPKRAADVCAKHAREEFIEQGGEPEEGGE